MKSYKFRIQGTSDNKSGKIQIAVSGFKHSATMFLAAAPLLPSPLQIENFPKITDVLGMVECLQYLGCDIRLENNKLTIDSRNLSNREIPFGLTKYLHGPLYFLPSLAIRLGSFRIGPLGGCRIGDPAVDGERPTKHVLEVLRHFGARAENQSDGGFYVKWAEKDLADITLDVQKWSTDPKALSGPLISGVTKTAVLAAIGLKSGVTTILNPDLRSETQLLIDTCITAGWDIEQGSHHIKIFSYREESRPPVSVQIPSDLIEILTYIALAVCSNQTASITITPSTNVERDLAPEMLLLSKMGVKVLQKGTELLVSPCPPHRAFKLRAGPPGIYSDSQPFFALMATTCDGVSVIRDNVWRNRFDYVNGLREMGLNIFQDKNDGTIAISPGPLNTTELTISGGDLRSTAVLTIAASSRTGVTFLRGAHMLARGYEDLPGKLRGCGVGVEIIADEDEK